MFDVADVAMLALVIVVSRWRRVMRTCAIICLRFPPTKLLPHDGRRLAANRFIRRRVGLLTHPAGGYLARVYAGERTLLRPLLGPIETALYRLAGVKPEVEQSWFGYAVSFLVFHALGIVTLYALLRLQASLPLNPQELTGVAPDLALNTAVSFVTNTSWQSYSGETTLSYASQMIGITVQSFLSAAAGMAVAIALIRGFSRRRSATIGNFWVDLTRGTLYVLLPICVVAALFLVGDGVPQTLAPSAAVTTLEGGTQAIARGPVAILYAYTSAAATNGSAFAVLSANSQFYNLTRALGMFIGRFFVIVPVLAVAGSSLAAQPVIPRSNGTLPTDRALFVCFLLGVIVIVGGLTYLPALALGPAIEGLQLLGGVLY